MSGYDLVSIGRTGVDIYPLDHGVGLEEVSTFQKFLGGSATNVAVAAARYGRSAALVTRTGADPFGRYVRLEAERLGVDPAFISSGDGPPTPVTFCEVFPPDDFPLYFYRYPTAPGPPAHRPTTCRESAIRDARISGSPSPACPRSRRGPPTSPPRGPRPPDAHHPRPRLPADVLGRPVRGERAGRRGAVARHGRRGQPRGVRGRRGRDRAAASCRRPARAGPGARDRQAGPQGRPRRHRRRAGRGAAVPVEVVNGLGAGDAFGGALVHGLLAGWDLRRILEFANVAGALVAAKLECSTAMPDQAEVEQALARRPAPADPALQKKG